MSFFFFFLIQWCVKHLHITSARQLLLANVCWLQCLSSRTSTAQSCSKAAERLFRADYKLTIPIYHKPPLLYAFLQLNLFGGAVVVSCKALAQMAT